MRASPLAYEWSFLGVLIFLLGGLGDMTWHLIFGGRSGSLAQPHAFASGARRDADLDWAAARRLPPHGRRRLGWPVADAPVPDPFAIGAHVLHAICTSLCVHLGG